MDGHDDPVAGRRAGVACDWLYRHAEGLSVVGLAGPGDSSARPAERPSVLLPWTQRQSSESDLARRSGRMPVYQAARGGRFLWPRPADGVVTISSAPIGYLLSGTDWRHPQETWRPNSVG